MRRVIDHAVLQAEWDAGDYRAMNDDVVRLVQEYPERLTGYCTVNPGADDDMAAVVEREGHRTRHSRRKPCSHSRIG